MRGQAEVYGALVMAMLLVAGVGVYRAMVNQAYSVVNTVGSAVSSDALRRSENIYFSLEGAALTLRSTTSTVVRSLIVYDSSSVLYSNDTPVELAPGMEATYILPADAAARLAQGSATVGVFTVNGGFTTWDPVEQALQAQGYRDVRIHVVDVPVYPSEKPLFNYSGSGVLESITLYTYSASITVTRIIVDGIQVNTAPLVAGASGSLIPAQFSTVTLPLNAVFKSSIQVYGYASGSGALKTIILTIALQP